VALSVVPSQLLQHEVGSLSRRVPVLRGVREGPIHVCVLWRRPDNNMHALQTQHCFSTAWPCMWLPQGNCCCCCPQDSLSTHSHIHPRPFPRTPHHRTCPTASGGHQALACKRKRDKAQHQHAEGPPPSSKQTPTQQSNMKKPSTRTRPQATDEENNGHETSSNSSDGINVGAGNQAK
jgi:hypothetical protein